jgi:hypothetical protein
MTETSTLTEDRILDLISLTDPVGVISVYVGITHDRTGSTPGWEIAVRNQLRDLVQRAREERPHEEWTAVEERVDSLERDLERLLDASRSGLGRALFAPVGSDRVETIALQIPFRDRAILDRNPYVRPLVAAVDEGRPAGIVALSKRGIRVLEWNLGVAEELDREEFSVGGRDWKEKSGPAPAQPQDGRHGGHRRDEFEQRLAENRNRFLRDQARAVADVAAERGWDRLIVAGDGRLSNTFSEALHPAGGEQLQVTDHSWDEAAPNEVAEQAWDVFRGLRRDRARYLIEAVRDRALSGNAGALGLGEVLASLNEGRVDHLLVDAEGQLEGWRSPDGYLYATDERPQAEAAQLTEEPYLIERMIERAVQTKATVTPVEAEVVELLREHGGVGAILRW